MSSTRKSALGTESLVVSGDCLGVGGMSNICRMRREGRGRGGEGRGKGGRGGGEGKEEEEEREGIGRGRRGEAEKGEVGKKEC